MKALVMRPFQLIGLVFAVTLLVALGVLALFTWTDFERIQTVRARVERTRLLQDAGTSLKRAEEDMKVRGSGREDDAWLRAVRRDFEHIPVLGGPVGPVTRERLDTLNRLLEHAKTRPDPAIREARALVETMLERETQIQAQLLDTVFEDIRLERRVALAALVGFPCLVVLLLWALRQRILRPIGNLGALLSRLSEGDRAPVSLTGIDPLLVPLFENYNQMVTRLAQLEESTRSRTLSLEQEVRAATGTLLKQQQSLARAERLATAGEVSATLAHELRNPIAGIHVTLSNLRSELKDPGVQRRIDLVIAELQRVTRLLNGLLQQSSHVPEPRRTVRVCALVQELATLVRYQLPSQVRLEVDAPDDFSCPVPEDGLRQALLNLVLNAVEALPPAGGTVSIGIERQPDRLCFRVLDDGPGFPDDLLGGGARAFVTSRETGTGLGLAIVKRFARDLGGELAFSNHEPHGACATLTLPRHD
ncbi:MAG: HAMP domain-containing sensor histidine kinase [Burkholderiales bacterium]